MSGGAHKDINIALFPIGGGEIGNNRNVQNMIFVKLIMMTPVMDYYVEIKIKRIIICQKCDWLI